MHPLTAAVGLGKEEDDVDVAAFLESLGNHVGVVLDVEEYSAQAWAYQGTAWTFQVAAFALETYPVERVHVVLDAPSERRTAVFAYSVETPVVLVYWPSAGASCETGPFVAVVPAD